MEATIERIVRVTVNVTRSDRVPDVPTHRQSIYIVPELVTVEFYEVIERKGPFRVLTARGASYRLLASGQRKETHRTDEVSWGAYTPGLPGPYYGTALPPNLNSFVMRLEREYLRPIWRES